MRSSSMLSWYDGISDNGIELNNIEARLTKIRFVKAKPTCRVALRVKNQLATLVCPSC